ncbi:MAG TPA: deoxyribose-phosphate aldolase [Verrucomicrobiales bacterium]|nr:deoxyribose-phosphate aldolase [Verrucomicrobiales bacterium]
MTQLTAAQLAALIDHTLLKPEATTQDIDRLCAEALEHKFCTVCVHGSRVARAYALVEETPVKVAAVVGFPHGAMDADAKRYETEVAVDHGAEEIDVVVNIGRLKEGDHRAVFRELRDVVEAADERAVKVILETSLLTREEILHGCKLSVDAGARFVKTSTGFGSAGATVENVRLMREAVGPTFGVKASGGIRDLATALAMVEAGATRLGCSAGVQILKSLPPPAPVR